MFFITCFEKKQTKDGWPDFGDLRVFGYYESKQQAIDALHENRFDMFEFLYHYAVVEQIGAGIHPNVEWRQFFKYDTRRNGFFEIEEPEQFSHLTNMALG